MIRLRGYQDDALNALRAGHSSGHRKQMLSAPTGAGKTEMAMSLIQAGLAQGSRCLFLVDRVVLLRQTSERFFAAGIHHGVIGGGMTRSTDSRVLIAMQQTLELKAEWPLADLIIVDECHVQRRATTDYIRSVDAAVIGLTATGFSIGMADTYAHVVNAATTYRLAEDGFLIMPDVYTAQPIDMTGAKMSGGEWTDKAVEERATAIVGDIVSEWASHTQRVFGGPVKTLVFSPTIAYGAMLAREFNAAGYLFAQVAAKPKGPRPDDLYAQDADEVENIRRFRNGEIHGLISVDKLAKGFDVPDVLCGVSARPYRKSLAGHIQQLGRVMRTAPGKSKALWLDHACVAADQRVLTRRGMVPICNVRPNDLLWDGEEWVAHGGVVRVGKRQVMEYAGLKGTGDHKVWTARGWLTLREASEALEPIAETGIEGMPVRLGANCFRSGGASWRGGQPQGACALRMRDLRLSIHRLFAELANRADGWLPTLQPASAAVSGMALPPHDRRDCAMPEQSQSAMAELWRAGYRVPLYRRKGGLPVGDGEPRLAGCAGEYGPRPDEQRRPLRAGQSALGSAPGEPQQYAEDHRCNHSVASVPHRPSGRALRRFNPAWIFRSWLQCIGNHRAVAPAVQETEGEVWDILNAGPRNRFTCEGLLTHNSNFTRFWIETDHFWRNGIDSLEAGKLQRYSRIPAEKENAELTCYGCGYVMTPKMRLCPMCGHERPAPKPRVKAQPGRMERFRSLHDEVGDLWPHVSAYALGRHPTDPDRALRFARANYKELTGQWPQGDLAPADECDPRVAHEIDLAFRRWVNRQRRRAA